MDENDSPPLSQYEWEEIDKQLHEVDKEYWPKLLELRYDKFKAVAGPPSPTPPRLPDHLRRLLAEYARRLFVTESAEYRPSPHIEAWLRRLAIKMADRVINSIDRLESSLFDRITGNVRMFSFSWHGLSRDDMRSTIDSALEEEISLTLVRYGSISSEVVEGKLETAHDIALEQTAAKSIEESAGQLAETRSKLLEEYKAATGNPSNMQIYQASNSGIFKPEFYKWRRGKLPEDSKITVRFERFLRAKKRPIPRNSAS